MGFLGGCCHEDDVWLTDLASSGGIKWDFATLNTDERDFIVFIIGKIAKHNLPIF